jgi:ribosome-associated protein YbcJ (S4-like RNA binding protein)
MDSGDLETEFAWIKEQERLQTIQSNYPRESMDKISIKYIYINQNKYISKILCEVLPIVNSVISQEQILHLIKKYNFQTPTSKYKLKDILLFNITLEPEHVQTYAKNDDFIDFSSPFLKVLSILDKITIPESIFIFHEINTLYFIFQEMEIQLTGSRIKSILKKEPEVIVREPEKNKKTKKVRISIGNKPVHINKISTHGTRRNRNP